MSIDSFMESTTTETLESWGNVFEQERRNRIRLSIAAYAYEFCNESIMSDSDYDSLSLKINPIQPTVDPSIWCQEQISRYKKLDEFFSKQFSPDTGQWIHKHPELDIVAWCYNKYYKKR